MLAAAQEKVSSLELVRTIFSLIRADDPNIPQQLKSHLVAIIQQAQKLAVDPSKVDDDILPEAIRLALAIKSERGLVDELAHVTDFDSIRPDLAKRVLAKMELTSA